MAKQKPTQKPATKKPEAKKPPASPKRVPLGSGLANDAKKAIVNRKRMLDDL